MADRISLALVLHNHQPVGNFGWVIEDSYQRAYAPMVAALTRHPSIRVALHYTGPLVDWLRVEHPEFLSRLRALVDRGQVELVGGAYYEPVLASIPERDRLAQLRRMAVEVEAIGGSRPTGAWLAERVWEPDVPTSLVDAGYRWTVLDDSHFRAAAVDETDMWGAYTTEDQGRVLIVFGTDKTLRYGVPFGPVEAVIDHLRSNATPDASRLAVMGDDGEKFGSWPETYEHCWGTDGGDGTDGADGWVESFFTALEASASTIATVTPSDWLAEHEPIGRVSIPTSSYAEMGQWALPADEAGAFEAAQRDGEAVGAPWTRWLRGGFWRNFQVKYREVNDLHAQMLRASESVDAMSDGRARDLAVTHLHRGQSNDCYWHGVFGGIYLAHLRLATAAELIGAQDIADEVARRQGQRADGLRQADADLDGRDEILVTLPGQVVVIDPARGGGIGTWDIRAVRHALASVLRRRPEAYHERLLAAEQANEPLASDSDDEAGTASDGVATIHELVRAREPGLAGQLQYDAYERRSGLVHLFARGTTLDQFATGTAVELGNAHVGPYDVRKLGAADVLLAREIELARARLLISKRLIFGADRREPTLALEVRVENRSKRPVRFDMGLEWALTMLGGGGNPDAYYRLDEGEFPHDGSGERDAVGTVVSGNRAIGLELTTTIDPPTRAWWSAIDTISSSEAGLERVYQGSALVAIWPLDLAPGGHAVVAMRHEIATAVDLLALEPAEPAISVPRRGPQNPSARGLRTTG